ncbi:MAG: beta domain, partial [Pseudomonadota bacterium]
EELPCSTMSGVSSNVAIQNPLAEVVRIYWRDDACEEVLYNTLSPGGGYSQGTFTGHVWVARRDADGALLDHHVVVGANELWSVTP